MMATIKKALNWKFCNKSRLNYFYFSMIILLQLFYYPFVHYFVFCYLAFLDYKCIVDSLVFLTL
eukprot:UN13612